jgi:lipid-binding SYLF domain-containing protein
MLLLLRSWKICHTAAWGTLVTLVIACSITPPVAQAKTAREIDVSVDVALERFYREVQGAKEFSDAAKGLLILPRVIKGGFFLGGEYGEGALRIGGTTADYYSIAGGSLGITFGGQQKDIVLAFLTQEVLDHFRASRGWEVGVDGNIALISFGAGDRVDTDTVKDPIVAFVFGVKGLILDISLKGAKLTRLQK